MYIKYLRYSQLFIIKILVSGLNVHVFENNLINNFVNLLT